MAMAALLGSVLRPSPLLLPFAPLISAAYAPFAVATTALGMPAGFPNLGIGGKAAFIICCALLGAVTGRQIGGWPDCVRQTYSPELFPPQAPAPGRGPHTVLS